MRPSRPLQVRGLLMTLHFCADCFVCLFACLFSLLHAVLLASHAMLQRPCTKHIAIRTLIRVPGVGGVFFLINTPYFSTKRAIALSPSIVITSTRQPLRAGANAAASDGRLVSIYYCQGPKATLGVLGSVCFKPSDAFLESLFLHALLRKSSLLQGCIWNHFIVALQFKKKAREHCSWA
jgi:hypothetical protein